MEVEREPVRYEERKKNEKRMRQLKAELRKFKKAHTDEGNNEKMDRFCLSAIKKIQAEMSQLSTRI